MGNFLFYAVTILIWGSTWLAIKFQLGTVDPVVSVAYRFALAALLLQLWSRATGRVLRAGRRDHLFLALQGICLFAVNYWLFYVAELHLASGLVAVVFSGMVVLNVVNGALFLRTPIEGSVLAGAVFGLLGICLVFWPELRSFSLSDQGLTGLLLSLAATQCASMGNILSVRNQRRGLAVMPSNAWGMSYGALCMVLVAMVTGRPFALELTWPYLGSLAYLSVFGSVIAFGCYLTLVGRIGAGRAAYTSLLFPLVALALSTWFEGYRWGGNAVVGVVLILAGNFIALRRTGGKPASVGCQASAKA